MDEILIGVRLANLSHGFQHFSFSVTAETDIQNREIRCPVDDNFWYKGFAEKCVIFFFGLFDILPKHRKLFSLEYIYIFKVNFCVFAKSGEGGTKNIFYNFLSIVTTKGSCMIVFIIILFVHAERTNEISLRP